MERPENCPERLYLMMCRCWQHRPSARPTFIQIVSMLLDEAKPNFTEVSFYYSQPGRELQQLPQRTLTKFNGFCSEFFLRNHFLICCSISGCRSIDRS